MSGGHFEYSQHRILDIADSIESHIHRVKAKEAIDGWVPAPLTKDTLAEFEKAVVILKTAYVYAQRIDYFLSGDDGEATFHTRLKEDLRRLQSIAQAQGGEK